MRKLKLSFLPKIINFFFSATQLDYEDKVQFKFRFGIWHLKPFCVTFTIPVYHINETTETMNKIYKDYTLSKTEFWKNGKKEWDTEWQKIQKGEAKCQN